MTNTEKLEQAELKLNKKVIDILTKEVLETNSDFSKWGKCDALCYHNSPLKSPNGDYLVTLGQKYRNEKGQEGRAIKFTLLKKEAKRVYIFEWQNLEGFHFLFDFFTEVQTYFNNVRNEENALQELIGVNTTLATLDTIY